MAVHVDPELPNHPLSVDDLQAMVDAGILTDADRVELLDGVLVEVSPPAACISTRWTSSSLGHFDPALRLMTSKRR